MARVSVARGLRLLNVRNKWTNDQALAVDEPFSLILKDGTRYKASQIQLTRPLRRIHGNGFEALEADLTPDGGHLQIKWRLSLRNGGHYLRQEATFSAVDHDVDIRQVTLGAGAGTATTVGTVPGSPIVAGNYFAGLEHPMSANEGGAGWHLSMERKIPIRAGQSITYSSVIGVAPVGQMRRAVQSYLERERPRKYEPFLHYNSWYDLGFFTKFTAEECVNRINTFGQELVKRRGVKLQSFLFDDGWDDTSTVWKFHSGFPQGFEPLRQAAAQYGAAPGIWLSPWGGYGGPRNQRLATGRKVGMEIDSQGYALSGPKYYARFHEVCLDLVRRYGINQFKFDGTGSPDKQYPGSAFASDFEAAISLIHDLREAKPGLFINLTTGTWPSPFWTRYADSIWRGGSDHSFAGVGPYREQWITYRDGDTYHGIVQRGPLYPINSLMVHGLLFARSAQNLTNDPDGRFRNEIRTYFGSGTQLQEMYITPDLLSKQNWDNVAQSAKWSWANRDVLVDSHWVGGDPNNLEVYGWASWSPRKAILTLRNPSDKAQAFSIEPSRVFELPPSVKGRWVAKDPYGESSGISIAVGASKVVVLKPFEVRLLEGGIR
ncbi:putative enterotoxin [Fimbriimonas ginsengisoli Gsoil 348]|uniref:Putative enterotoxin n=2 Tax=Fimbriimonas ginsengisoli TaxID=1005039 RepID=A0A068NQW6_FIMGI|nr:putative enterotoxin [Fimbriimonas ginsengisoli Gsoil 348]